MWSFELGRSFFSGSGKPHSGKNGKLFSRAERFVRVVTRPRVAGRALSSSPSGGVAEMRKIRPGENVDRGSLV